MEWLRVAYQTQTSRCPCCWCSSRICTPQQLSTADFDMREQADCTDNAPDNLRLVGESRTLRVCAAPSCKLLHVYLISCHCRGISAVADETTQRSWHSCTLLKAQDCINFEGGGHRLSFC